MIANWSVLFVLMNVTRASNAICLQQVQWLEWVSLFFSLLTFHLCQLGLQANGISNRPDCRLTCRTPAHPY